MLLEVFNYYQYYLGCTTNIINVIRGVQVYQYYQGCTTTIIYVISGVQPLSMLLGVYNFINVIRGVQSLSGVYNHYQHY